MKRRGNKSILRPNEIVLGYQYNGLQFVSVFKFLNILKLIFSFVIHISHQWRFVSFPIPFIVISFPRFAFRNISL